MDQVSDGFRSFVLHSTASGRLIRDRAETPVIEYLRTVAVPDHALVGNDAAKALSIALEATVERDYGREVAARALAELRARPVIQMADGADLLLDLETLINHLMFQAACREANLRYMWTQQCTTVRAITSRSALRGAALLETDADVFSVFRASRRRLSHANVACMGRTELELRPLGVKTAPYASAWNHRRGMGEVARTVMEGQCLTAGERELLRWRVG